MIFGINYEADEFLDEITKKESGAERTFKGRRNSMDALFTNKADQSKDKKRKSGLVNRTQSHGESPTETSPMISVKRLRTRNMYEDIPESDEESKSTIKTDSELITMNTSQREKMQDMKQSNIFLMKVIHGNVPHELLASRITSTDRENLSTLMPHFGSQG